MTDNVKPIRKYLPEQTPLKQDCVRVNPAVVELLESLLESAKRGEVHAFAMIYTAPKNHDHGDYPARAYAGLRDDWCNRHVIAAGLFGFGGQMMEGTWG